MKSTAIDRANLSVCLQVASGGDAEERGRLAADGEGMSGDFNVARVFCTEVLS